MDLQSVDELLTTTRSVRRRLDLTRAVPREVILECLTLALQAPTGGASEQWRWIIIDDPTGRARVAEYYSDGAHILAESRERATAARATQAVKAYSGAEYLLSILDQVPVLVLPCVRGRLADGNTLRAASLFGSILPAVWSFMLALRSRGLGSAWTTLHLQREHEVAEYLGIPAGYIQAALIPVAYTTGSGFKPAKRRPVDEVTYWGRWPEGER